MTVSNPIYLKHMCFEYHFPPAAGVSNFGGGPGKGQSLRAESLAAMFQRIKAFEATLSAAAPKF